MNANPLVSVIIPVYNRRELLARTINSVVTQTYKNLEIIIIDDGSEENIKPIAEGFNDKRIKYLRCVTNSGVSEARNTGIKAASGEFIAFLDSDDEFLPEKTERQLEIFFKNPPESEVGAVYCGLWKEKNNQKQYFFQRSTGYKWFFLIQRLMVRREIIKKAGFFDTAFISAEDLDYVYRLSRICEFAGTREPLVIYHDTPVSITKNRDYMRECEELFLKKHYGTIPPEERSRRLYYLGRDYLRDGCLIRGYKVFFKSYVSYPLNEKSLRKLIRLTPGFLFHVIKRKSPMKRAE